MLTCKEASKLVSEGQERGLGLREKIGLRLHLWICVNCRRFERQLHLLRQVLQRMATQADVVMQTPSLSPEARERIRKAIAEKDGHSH